MRQDYLDIPNTRKVMKTFKFKIGDQKYRLDGKNYDDIFLVFLNNEKFNPYCFDDLILYLEVLYRITPDYIKVDLPEFMNKKRG